MITVSLHWFTNWKFLREKELGWVNYYLKCAQYTVDARSGFKNVCKYKCRPPIENRKVCSHVAALFRFFMVTVPLRRRKTIAFKWEIYNKAEKIQAWTRFESMSTRRLCCSETTLTLSDVYPVCNKTIMMSSLSCREWRHLVRLIKFELHFTLGRWVDEIMELLVFVEFLEVGFTVLSVERNKCKYISL